MIGRSTCLAISLIALVKGFSKQAGAKGPPQENSLLGKTSRVGRSANKDSRFDLLDHAQQADLSIALITLLPLFVGPRKVLLAVPDLVAEALGDQT